MQKLVWFLLITIALTGIGYGLGYEYLQKYPNTDTLQSEGGLYSQVIQSAHDKDNHELLLFTLGGALVGSVLGFIKVQGDRTENR